MRERNPPISTTRKYVCIYIPRGRLSSRGAEALAHNATPVFAREPCAAPYPSALSLYPRARIEMSPALSSTGRWDYLNTERTREREGESPVWSPLFGGELRPPRVSYLGSHASCLPPPTSVTYGGHLFAGITAISCVRKAFLSFL